MSFLRLCLLLAASVVACHGQAMPDVSRAKDLYRLNRDEMLRPTPVKIRGIVTYNRGGEFNDFTMQDETGGFIADAPGPANALMTGLIPGQEVEIEGVTMINPPPTPRVKVTRLIPGKQVGLPEPMPFTPEALLGGAGRLCYVEFSGVIREAHIDPNLMPARLILTFGPPENRLAVWLARFNDATVAALKPDTRVRVHGVSMAWTSANLQPYSTFVVAHDPTQIDVLSPAQPTATLPVTSIGQLLSTSPERFENRRQRIRGSVTLIWPGEAVVIQDETGGVRSSPAEGDTPELGALADGFGFSSPDQGRVILDEATYQNGAPGEPPQPEEISASALLREAPVTDRDALLIRTTGLFQNTIHRANYMVLQMESQGIPFDVLLPPGKSVPPDILPGSQLELTGVTRFIFSGRSTWAGDRALNRFEIHLPEMAGITVLSKPAWWTLQRLAVAAGTILFCLLLSLLWIVSLRHRVASRSAMLVREIKARHNTQLLVDERSRLAADLHDTLSQTLSGAALQMEIADSLDDAAARDHRSLARRLLDRSREDLRRAVWDLTPSVLLTRDLETAFSAIATELAADNNCTIKVTRGADLPLLPERTRSHLLRVGQEAIYNAIRHGGAAHIRLSLSQSQDRLVLRVEDDGSGFDPAAAPGPTEGHLGLSSMRNRIQRLAGDFQIKTSTAGTIVTASVPITTTSDEP
jgi:signal transduction histidine kinase